MANCTDLKIQIRNKPSYVALYPGTIEKTFTDAVIDLKGVIVLDGIDILPDESGFRVRSHDFHGQLPEIVIHDSGNTMEDKESLSREACKLIAIVGLRKEMRRLMRGGKFLLLICRAGGIQFQFSSSAGKTWFGEPPNNDAKIIPGWWDGFQSCRHLHRNRG